MVEFLYVNVVIFSWQEVAARLAQVNIFIYWGRGMPNSYLEETNTIIRFLILYIFFCLRDYTRSRRHAWIYVT